MCRLADEALPSAVARLEEMPIRRALNRSSGNRTEAVKQRNINRQLLYSKLERYGLTTTDEANSSTQGPSPD
jgi:DNA-binding NtrC family response regulator